MYRKFQAKNIREIEIPFNRDQNLRGDSNNRYPQASDEDNDTPQF